MKIEPIETYQDSQPDLDEEDFPPDEKCPGCPNHKNGPHKFRCTFAGVQQVKLPAILEGEGFKVKLP